MEERLFKIPNYLDKDNYLQNPILKRFCKEHGLKTTENRADLIREITDFANVCDENKEDTISWLVPKLKEGSKEYCYKKIYSMNPVLKNPIVMQEALKKIFPDCPFDTLFSCNTSEELTCINYDILVNDKNEVSQISLIFTRLVLEGKIAAEFGDYTTFPVFIDLYLNEGFIVSAAKAKSTLFDYSESKFLARDHCFDTKKNAVDIIDTILSALSLETIEDTKKVKNINSQMLYKLYNEYSFTPQKVQEEIDSVKDISHAFVYKIFEMLNLSPFNKESALTDISIFIEKYVSINGNNESIFKEDRDAYLVQITSDDVQDTTKVDTESSLTVPLQCTEAFFDNKKTVVKNKKCNKINLCFKRKKYLYFGNKPFCVLFSTKGTVGTFKISYYAEEADVDNVLQTIFKNY